MGGRRMVDLCLDLVAPKMPASRTSLPNTSAAIHREGTGSGLGFPANDEGLHLTIHFNTMRWLGPHHVLSINSKQKKREAKQEESPDRNSIKFNGYDHRAGTEIIASIGTRKSGFACIVLLSRVFLNI
jgi:hypothetical protein